MTIRPKTCSPSQGLHFSWDPRPSRQCLRLRSHGKFDGQGKLEGSATIRIAGGPQASVCFNYRTAKRQAHAGALGLRREKRVKNPVRPIGR